MQALFDNLPKDSFDDLVGVGDLSDVAHLLSRCDFFVGNDSGLMHMSAALGVPTLGLFGPSRIEHYAPWGPKCGYVRTKESYEEIVGAPGTTIAPREFDGRINRRCGESAADNSSRELEHPSNAADDKLAKRPCRRA